MRNLGQAGSGRPQARNGDYERALSLLSAVNGDLETKEYLRELQVAALAHDKASEEASAAIAEAKSRDARARQTEDAARSQRESLARETADAETQLRRERRDLEDERARLGAWSEELGARATDIDQREAALRRAFEAYTKGD